MLTFETLSNNIADELSAKQSILYEVSDHLAGVIISFNRLGFLTYTSQPGNEYTTVNQNGIDIMIEDLKIYYALELENNEHILEVI